MSVYDIAAYGAMIADKVRFAAYRRALQEVVQPDSAVLDIGTGTGIHALLACELGARVVYAIETSDTIQVARDIARDNGLADRIVFFHEAAERVTLPEPADVMVSDLRGIVPFFGRHLPTIIDARSRLLRPGGSLVPMRDTVWIAPVEATADYAELVEPWAAERHGFDMSVAHRMVTQKLYRRRFDADALLGAGRPWTTIDYRVVESASAGGEVPLQIERDGTLHGFALWFDAELTEDVGFSNAPGGDELIYGTYFLPLPQPLPVKASTPLTVALAADLVGDEYVWRWNTLLANSTEPRVEQSTFAGSPLSSRSLMLAASEATPELSAEGVVDRAALGMIDGTTPLSEIADHLLERFPQTFANHRDALQHIAELARRYAD